MAVGRYVSVLTNILHFNWFSQTFFDFWDSSLLKISMQHQYQHHPHIIFSDRLELVGLTLSAADAYHFIDCCSDKKYFLLINFCFHVFLSSFSLKNFQTPSLIFHLLWLWKYVIKKLILKNRIEKQVTIKILLIVC